MQIANKRRKRLRLKKFRAQKCAPKINISCDVRTTVDGTVITPIAATYTVLATNKILGDAFQKTMTESIAKKEDRERSEWALGDYANGETGCPNCGRMRLCVCPNGKHRCEKCNWSPELNGYAPCND